LEGAQLRAGRDAMTRRLRWAGAIAFLGVLIEALALMWTHPTAFLAFALIGIPLVLLGVLIFLWSLVSAEGAGD
jgi:hypothetical protein